MRTISIFCVVLSCLISFGCKTGASFRVEAVEGVVTLDGKPVEGATLTFVPSDSSMGKAAYARTDAQGRYKLTATGGGQSGAGTMTGRYDVAITLDVPSREPTAKELENQERGIVPNIPMISVVPKKYNDAKTSELSAEVVKGKNRFDFELKSEAK